MKTYYSWVIVSKNGYWSNEIGWVYTVDDATIFFDKNVNLPIGVNVRWVPVKENMNRFKKLEEELL